MDSYATASNVTYAYAAYVVVGAVLGSYLTLLLRRLSHHKRALAALRVTTQDPPPQRT